MTRSNGDSKRPALPKFFVLGTQKAATTSLDAWLRVQPEVDLPEYKETDYLSNDERYAKGLDWYLARFPSAERRIRGEVDPDYLSEVHVPERMAQMYGADGARPRLVVVLREPVARAYSQWQMSTRRGLETRAFDVALEASWRDQLDGAIVHGHRDYYSRGRYTEHMARFRAALPGCEWLVLLFQEVVDPAQQSATFRRLCEFVGVLGEPQEPDFGAILNPAGVPRSRHVNRLLYRASPLRRVARHLLPSQNLRLKLGVFLERLNTTRSGTGASAMPTLPAPVVRAMHADVASLESELGRDLTSWKETLDGYAQRRTD